MKKFFLFTVICLAVLLGFAPKAQAQTVWDGSIDLTWYDADQSSFDISTPAQLAGVAQLVNAGIANFSGKTLNLIADIWLNSTGDSTNNWTPIGGGSPSSESPTTGYAFKGAVNGHGHSIYNLYCDKGNTFHAGLFCALENPCTIDSLVLINPVLKSRGMMGCIAGYSRGSSPVYVRNCLVVNARIEGVNTSGSNNIGGIFGATYPNSGTNGNTYIQDCGVTGSITGNYPAGASGNAERANITNFYFAGTLTPYGTNYGGISAHGGNRTNCYSYTVVNGSFTQSSASSDGTVVTQSFMQSDSAITALGSAFKMDYGMNNGYPIMSYMAGVTPAEAEICTGESITLTAYGYDSYSWSTGATSESITVSPTSTTTYTVTVTTGGASYVLSSTITVHPSATITVEAVASSDGQTHGTVTPTTTSVACGSSDNVTITITPDVNWHIARITMNGETLREEDPSDGAVVPFTFNPNGTLAHVKVFFSNKYTITATTVLDNGTPLTVSGLVSPWGNNGVYNATQGDSVAYSFNETSVYHVTDVTIDDLSYGAINNYTFYDVAGPHTITVTYGACGPVENLTVSQVMGTSALVSWSVPTVGTVVDYTLEYKEANDADWTAILNLNSTQYLLSGLTPQGSYQVRVKSTCDNTLEGGWVTKSFNTPCLLGGDVAIGEGTQTTGYFPAYCLYNYSLTEQIFTNTELGGANTFHSISFNLSSVSTPNRNLDIYLMPTTETSLSSFVNVDTNIAVKVFSGTVNLTTGWYTVYFDTPYVFDGTTNLMLIVDDNTGSWSSTNYYYYTSTPSGVTSVYIYNDPTNYDPSTATSYSPYTASYRCNVIFGGECDSTALCVAPNIMIGACDENSIEVLWVPGNAETSWNLEYKEASDTDWMSAYNLTGSSYIIAGLDPDTKYDIRMQSDCGSETSDWFATTGRTGCGIISVANEPWTSDFEGTNEEYLSCWVSPVQSQYGNRTFPNIEHTASIAHGGSAALEIGFGNVVTSLPLFAEDISTLQIAFWNYHNTSGSTALMELGYITDPESPSTFVPVDTLDYTTYTQHIRQFDILAGLGLPATTRIAFRYTASSSNQRSYYFDDMEVSLIPTCMFPTALAVSGVGEDNVTLSWTELGSAASWNVLYGPHGFNPDQEGDLITASTNPFTVDNLLPITQYDFYLQSDCGGLQSTWVGPVSATTGIFNLPVTGTDTLTTCGTIIYDDGGANGNYSLNCDATLVIYPATPGTMLMLSGTCVTESSYDHLYIYDGVGTSGTQLIHVSGTNNNISVISTQGPLTIHFTSDYAVNYAGIALTAECVSCFPPSNVISSNVTTTGADISWSGSADAYAVYVYGADTTYYTTTDTFINLSNLTASSSYTVRVRSLCTGDSSVLSSAHHFNTSCGAITITATEPWEEDFEGYSGSGTTPFVCWLTPQTYTANNGTFPAVYVNHSPACHSGYNSCEVKGDAVMMVLPEFTNDIQDLRLSFWATATNTSVGTMEIGVITDPSDPTTFVPVVANAGTPGSRGPSNATSTPGSYGNYMGPFDFNGVQVTTGRIALRYTSTNAPDSWNMDDFIVELAPGCPSPVKTSVQASNVGGHVATITFTDNDPTHNSWTVYYKPSTDSVWTSIMTSTTSVDLTGLDPETAYDVYVVTNCTSPDPVEDQTHTIHFTTTVACPAPTNITATNVGMTTATISWQGTADSYNITCGTDNLTSTTNSVDLTGLTAGTNYTVTVQADCGVEGTSTAATFTFSTALCDVVDQCVYTFYLMDTYGDGWNGATVYVQQNGATVVTLGLSDGYSNTVTVPLCDNQSTSLIWNTGNFDYECGLTVSGPNGDAVYATSGTPSGTLTTFTTNCSGSGPATDPTVTTDAATYVSTSAATLNATITNPDDVTISAKGFEWKTTMGGTYAPVAGTGSGNTFSATLSTLTPNTSYSYKAFITYNGTTVYGDEVTFTTQEQQQETCPAPTNLTATLGDPSHTTVTLTWQQEANTANEWQINYRQTTEDNWSTATVTSTTYTLTDLVANVDYEANVVAHCTNGLTSEASNTVTWHTDDVGIQGYLERSVTLYPNPATEMLNVAVSDANITITGVEVYNVFGQIVETSYMASLQDRTVINVSNLADGMYYVRVTTDGGVVTKNFVKR